MTNYTANALMLTIAMFGTVICFFWDGFRLCADASVANRRTRNGDWLRAVHTVENGVRRQIVVVGVVVVVDRNSLVSDLDLDAVGDVGLDVDGEAVDAVDGLLKLIWTFFLLRVAKTFSPEGAQQQGKEQVQHLNTLPSDQY